MKGDSDDMSVKDALTGQTVYKIKTNDLTLHGIRTLAHPGGDPVAVLKNQLNVHKMHDRQDIYDASGTRVVATVRKANLFQCASDALVDIDGAPYMEIRGNIVGHEFDFVVDRQLVARAGRDIGTFARHCEPGSYLLEVAANMDLALVVTIVAAIDQMFSD